ncbi:MAG: YihY/virulence factor BrkB family protein [Planctomycetota bacterium]
MAGSSADSQRPPSTVSEPDRRQRVARFLTRDIWRREWVEAPTFAAFGVYLLRLATIAGRGIVERNQGLRAAALTYYTVLSLVPTLAFAFSLAKGFGAYDRLERDVIRPFVESTFGGERLDPEDFTFRGGLLMPRESWSVVYPKTEAELEAVRAQTSSLRDAVDQVLAFVTNTDVSSLGSIGLAVLIFTVVKLMGHVEAALNATFGIKRLRSIPRRIADYTAMATITPIVAISATAVGAASSSERVKTFFSDELNLEPVVAAALKLVPLLGFTLGFALLFLIMPNTRVKIRSALIGGLVAAALWTVSQRIYVGAQVGVASYNSLYAGFAAIPLFLVWTWMSWMVVLAGAEFAHADQNHRSYGDLRLAGTTSQADIERAGLRILVRMTGRFRHGKSPLTVADMVRELAEPSERVRDALERLGEAGLILEAEVEDEETAWVFAVDPASIRVEDARRALRGRPADLVQASSVDRALMDELRSLDTAEDALGSNHSLDALAARIEEQLQ